MAEKQVSVRIKAEGAGQLKAEFQAIGAEAQKSFGQIDRGARLSGSGLQNAGYQVQDFAVQVAGGTDVSRAFAQQLPQLLSGLGLMGVLMGTVAAVAIPLFAAFGLGTDKAEEFAKSIKTLDAAMRDLKAASEAADVNPGDLMGRFGGENIEQARQVLEIQRQIAAARAENALAQTSSSLTSVFGDFSAALQDSGAELNILDQRLYALSDIADALGLDFEAAQTEIMAVATALQAVADADGPQAQADAMAQLRGAILDAADAGGVLSDEALSLLDSLTDAELAALGLASVDLAGPIAAGADEASRLATNLFDALAAQHEFDRKQAQYGGRGEGPGGITFGPQKWNPSAEIIKEADRIVRGSSGRGGGGGGRSAANDAEREAARIYDQTRTAAEKYAIELAKLNELHKSGELDTETYTRAVEKLGKDLDKAGDLGKKAASAIRGAFDNLFDDPAAALKNLSKQLFQMALYQQLANSFPAAFGANGVVPLLNANGNVFEGGAVTAFAGGGIVSSATMFPMRGGMGVMGEAGPEAIMPLTRIGGKLGVAAAGGGGSMMQVNVINNTGAPVERRESGGRDGKRQVDLIIGESVASGRQDGALRARFGVPPNKIKR